MDREAWPAAVHGVTKCRTRLSDWSEPNWKVILWDFEDWVRRFYSISWPFLTLGKFIFGFQPPCCKKAQTSHVDGETPWGSKLAASKPDLWLSEPSDNTSPQIPCLPAPHCRAETSSPSSSPSKFQIHKILSIIHGVLSPPYSGVICYTIIIMQYSSSLFVSFGHLELRL